MQTPAAAYRHCHNALAPVHRRVRRALARGILLAFVAVWFLSPASAAARVSGDGSLPFPIRAAFYYPWFPNGWNQQGYICGQAPPAGSPATPSGCFTNYHPSLGFSSSFSPAVVDSHIRSMQYAGLQAGIASWWGQGSHTDQAFPGLLREANQLGSGFKWAIYYEPAATPNLAQISSDLAYIQTRYAPDPAYLKVNGKFVVWVYNDAGQGCNTPSLWQQANTNLGHPAYIGLKVFNNYKTCANGLDAWHQYAPAQAAEAIPDLAYTISPGFNKANEPNPRLPRDLNRWSTNIDQMIASNAPWQLITTFNEWGEGTAIESATEWATPSGQGSYLDLLHTKLNPTTPAATGTVARADPSGDRQARIQRR